MMTSRYMCFALAALCIGALSSSALPVRFREKLALEAKTTPIVDTVDVPTALPDLDAIATEMNTLLTSLLGTTPKTLCNSPMPCEAFNVASIGGSQGTWKIKIKKVTNLKTTTKDGEKDGWGNTDAAEKEIACGKDGYCIVEYMFSTFASNKATTEFIKPYGSAVGKPNGVSMKLGSADPTDAVHEVAHCYQTGDDPGQSWSEGPNELLTAWVGGVLGGSLKYPLSGTYAPYSWFIAKYVIPKFGFKLVMDYQQTGSSDTIQPKKFQSLRKVIDLVKNKKYDRAALILKGLPDYTSPTTEETAAQGHIDTAISELEGKVTDLEEGCETSGAEWRKPAAFTDGDVRPAMFCKVYAYQKANPVTQKVYKRIDEWCKMVGNEVAADPDFRICSFMASMFPAQVFVETQEEDQGDFEQKVEAQLGQATGEDAAPNACCCYAGTVSSATLTKPTDANSCPKLYGKYPAFKVVAFPTAPKTCREACGSKY